MAKTNDAVVKILLVEDHELVRHGLRMLVETNPKFRVVGEAGDSKNALAAAAQQQPDIILLDLDLGGESGLDYLPQLRSSAPGADVIILTGNRELEAHQLAVRLGAKGLVLKQKAGAVLLKAIEKVHEGEVWFDRNIMGSVIAGLSQKQEPSRTPEEEAIASLTGREREVVALVGEGLKNKQIAERLFISDTTVRHHLTSIFSKLGVQDRLELVIFSYQHGLARPPR